VRRVLIALALALPPVLGQAQQRGLSEAAEQAREAWLAHNPAALVANSPRLMIQLPGADPSVALGRDQAAALLADFLASAHEVETSIRAAREVEQGRGYVELQRRYRVAGTQDVRTQSLLLGYRLIRDGWVLVELRVVG
jgi:hypothetical protein